jgi:hypothetical protein
MRDIQRLQDSLHSNAFGGECRLAHCEFDFCDELEKNSLNCTCQAANRATNRSKRFPSGSQTMVVNSIAVMWRALPKAVALLPTPQLSKAKRAQKHLFLSICMFV